MLPLIIVFEKSFSELKSMPELGNWIILFIILCLVFAVSFFMFLINCFEFEFHQSLESTEYEPEDLKRFKQNLKKYLIVYTITLFIWTIGILATIIVFEHTTSLWKMICLLTLPMLFNGFLIYEFNTIKNTYNNI
jgi:ABC-type multidrug transport system permease subunit